MSIAQVSLDTTTWQDNPLSDSVMGWRVVIDSLTEKSIGQFYRVKLPDNTPLRKAFSNLATTALRKGMKISCRVINGELWIARRSDPQPQYEHLRRMKRNEEIVDLCMVRNLTYTKVAKRFGITRQRVEQICRNYQDFRQLPTRERPEAMKQFLAPYLTRATAQNHCLLCREEFTGKARLCQRCNHALRFLKHLRSELLCASRGNNQARRQAAYAIRKHGVKPEDLDVL